MSSPVSTDLSDKKPGLATAALALLVFLAAGAVVLIFLNVGRGEAKYDAERAAKRVENLAALREANSKIVNEYAVLDKEKGIYQLPLARAVELTAQDLAKIEPKAAYPVATPAPPAAPPADAAAPTDAAPADATPTESAAQPATPNAATPSGEVTPPTTLDGVAAPNLGTPNAAPTAPAAPATPATEAATPVVTP